MNTFIPDYRHVVDVASNRRPARLPLYEHIISPVVMERVMDVRFAELEAGGAAELDVFGALFAVNMLVHTPVGDTFTLEELTEDLQSAGFTNIKLLHPDPQMNAVVQARKQG